MAAACQINESGYMQCLNIVDPDGLLLDPSCKLELVSIQQVERELFNTTCIFSGATTALSKCQAIALATDARIVPTTRKRLSDQQKRLLEKLKWSGALDKLKAELEEPYYEVD